MVAVILEWVNSSGVLGQLYSGDYNMEVKKMIANYIIKRVNVFKGYKLDIELNLNVQQFLNGLDSISDDEESRPAVAS